MKMLRLSFDHPEQPRSGECFRIQKQGNLDSRLRGNDEL